jgi:hypothetical protein
VSSRSNAAIFAHGAHAASVLARSASWCVDHRGADEDDGDVDDVHAVFGLGPPAGAPGGGSLRLKKFSIEIERIERLVVRWRDPTHARRWDPTRGRAACESECAAGKEGARRAHAPTPRTIARALAMVLVP